MHSVLQGLDPNAPIAVLVVWIKMLPEDEAADPQALVEQLADPRILWFHDPERRAGKAVAAALGGSGQVAWDVYLGFDAGARWGEALQPRDWVHQLGDAWADAKRLHPGDKLEPALNRLVRRLLEC